MTVWTEAPYPVNTWGETDENLIAALNTHFDKDISGWVTFALSDVNTSISWANKALHITSTTNVSYIEAGSAQNFTFTPGPIVYKFKARADHASVGFLQFFQVTFDAYVIFPVTTEWQDFEIASEITLGIPQILVVGYNDFEVGGSWIEFDDIEIFSAIVWDEDVSVPGVNILSAFNTNFDTNITGWLLDPADVAGGTTFAWHAGAMRILGSPTSNLEAFTNHPEFAVPVSGRYNLRFKAKASEVTNGYFELIGQSGGAVFYPIATHWQQYEFWVTLPGPTLSQIWLGLSANLLATGWVDFDDIEVKPVTVWSAA